MPIVLVYDPAEALAQPLGFLLQTSGLELVFCRDASEAVTRAASPDLVLALAADRPPDVRAVEVLDFAAQAGHAWATLLLTDRTLMGEDRHRVLPARTPPEALAMVVETLAGKADLERRLSTLGQRVRAELEKGMRRQKLLDTVVKERTRELEAAVNGLKRAQHETIRVLAETIEVKDRYVKGHCARVAAYSVALAKAAGSTGSELEAIEVAALLHDIGKIGVREEVLNKPGPLNPDERAHMRQHPLIGWRIARQISAFAPALTAVRNHHERWDGGGYPDGLAGDAIPLGARIISLTDAFDAMATDRPYRSALGKEQAIAHLRDQAGQVFDPKLVETFVREGIDRLPEPEAVGEREEPAGAVPPPALKAG
jgi:putative nucleotidyltransferase with HDIG domain